MSIRLDPRRLGVLKRLAAESGSRPGDLVRIWVEERLDAERTGEAAGAAPGGQGLAALVASLTDRVAALESASSGSSAPAGGTPVVAKQASANGDKPKRGRKRVAAKPSAQRVALHDEIIAVLTDRGPLPAADIATAILERGRYAPPRSGKPLDAATVNARISNPTYRPRFTRSEGRIGLTEDAKPPEG